MVKISLSSDIAPGDMVYKRGNSRVAGRVISTTLKTATVCFQDYPVVVPKSRLRKVPWNFIRKGIREVINKLNC